MTYDNYLKIMLIMADSIIFDGLSCDWHLNVFGAVELQYQNMEIIINLKKRMQNGSTLLPVLWL